MPGIIFFSTKDVEKITNYYLEKENFVELWMDQGDCKILRQKGSNFLLGFCERKTLENQGCITFFYREKAKVDKLYKVFKEEAVSKPVFNEKYNIYQFFAKDPEGRTIEIQWFKDNINTYESTADSLKTRRSIRNYQDKPVNPKTLDAVFELCRYSPTSRNSQSYYFKIINDHAKQQKLASVRSRSSAPIGKSPIAVAICVESEKTLRPEQDGTIAAYHFMLASHFYGLGTCWIADMDRNSVKEILEIPQSHYVATVTPVGYPHKQKPVPMRRARDNLIED